MARAARQLRRLDLVSSQAQKKADSGKYMLTGVWFPSGSGQQQKKNGGQGSGGNDGKNETHSAWKEKLIEGGATAFGSVMVLGLIGYSYHQYYKSLVLRKMDKAFIKGFSSAELAALSRHMYDSPNLDSGGDGGSGEIEDDDWIFRGEQAVVDRIVDGTAQGHYHLITGEKGTGKTSMLLKAMRKIDGDGVAMLEANADIEIFRTRLGKALNYEFHEDYIGSLFSFKGPRESTSLLEIERAFNKMEKIALRRRARVGKPLLLIINRSHLLHDNDEGRQLLQVIQQRAELWAASRLVTVVFVSDEYWIEERLRPFATRMRVLPVHDVPRSVVVPSLRDFRARHFGEVGGDFDDDDSRLQRVYDKVGGRMRFLSQVARAADMDRVCAAILERERRWFLNQCWIYGGDMDDAAEEDQDFCAAAIVLAKVLLEKERAIRSRPDGVGGDRGDALPEVPLHEAREIMTRGDFIERHDHINIFSIDSNAMVRADSMAMQNVFRDVCSRPGFDAHLAATMERLDELESLGRTREIKIKDLSDGNVVRVDFDGGGERGGEPGRRTALLRTINKE
ncbi:hypothetical protein N3K66_001122 [Trichothecium roseum]|uniref:Uncharacterized protein n=1 Tax=Trichothecium roseum TaxID=47278 RepID=A0ACC0VFP3_9HYPO|nr:hypothetical protein N3K66_001122 [Trichothecium roseum]